MAKKKKHDAEEQKREPYALKINSGRTVCCMCGYETTGKIRYQAYDREMGIVEVCKNCFIKFGRSRNAETKNTAQSKERTKGKKQKTKKKGLSTGKDKTRDNPKRWR